MNEPSPSLEPAWPLVHNAESTFQCQTGDAKGSLVEKSPNQGYAVGDATRWRKNLGSGFCGSGAQSLRASETSTKPARTACSPSLNWTCTSFSASANVWDETSGPTAGVVPNAGGAPGGKSVVACAVQRLDAATNKPRDKSARNFLREFDLSSEPERWMGSTKLYTITGHVFLSLTCFSVC